MCFYGTHLQLLNVTQEGPADQYHKFGYTVGKSYKMHFKCL